MRDAHSPTIVANEVSLLRSASRSTAIVLVEGDDDIRFLRRFLMPPPVCRMLSCGGKPNLHEVVDLLAIRGVSGVLPICDRDYDDYLGLRRQDVVYVDYNDAELMTLHSEALHRVLAEVRPDRFHEDNRQGVIRFRDEVVSMAAKVGQIRLHSHQRSLGLSFKDVNIGNHVVDGKLEIGSYVSALLASSRDAHVTHPELIEVAEIRSDADSVANLSSGHDVCALIAAICNDGRTELLTPSVLEMTLRLAFDAACFQTTQLLGHIKTWEEQSGFEVLDPLVLS